MKVVIDTNVLLVCLPKKSKYRLIFDRFLEKSFELLVTNEILIEYEEIISAYTNNLVADNVIRMFLLSPNVKKIEVFYKWNLIINDKDDNKFTDCAIAGNADYIVSEDKHFDIIKEIEFPKLTLLSIDEFIDMLQKSKKT